MTVSTSVGGTRHATVRTGHCHFMPTRCHHSEPSRTTYEHMCAATAIGGLNPLNKHNGTPIEIAEEHGGALSRDPPHAYKYEFWRVACGHPHRRP